MNKFNVVLLKLPALYEILNEIKLELNFNLINFSEKNDEFKKYMEENPQTLILSPDTKDNYKNFILYNKVFKIKNLLQHINILLSKSNYDIKSNILIGGYLVDINSRTISKNNISLNLTEKEIDLLVYLNNSAFETSIVDLQKKVWKQSGNLETHTVETHIYRLRKKIANMFDDNSFIIYTNNGYKISK